MSYSSKSTAEEVTAHVDLAGKTVVITGVNSGLGFESMRVLALRGAKIIGLARTLEKAEQACAKIQGDLVPLACELSDWASVRAAADAIDEMGGPVDILICNAGIMAPKQLTTAHGLEMQFATNYMGHFILVRRLLEQVKLADAGRVVLLSSAAHAAFVMPGGIDFDNLDAHKGYRPWYFYGQSKMADLLFARALASELEGSRATAYAVHPGIIRTGLGRESGWLMKILMLATRRQHKTIPQGAATPCWAATQAGLEKYTGQYFSDCAPAAPHKLADDPLLVKKLWEKSTTLAADFLN
jgi:NAD(P)-dependent dehydrogenase (short-subunit alcohol dehydrogenase family)